mgnify:FL=1
MIGLLKAIFRYFFCPGARDPRIKGEDSYERAIVQAGTIEQLAAALKTARDERDEARKVAAQYYEKSQRCCKTCAWWKLDGFSNSSCTYPVSWPYKLTCHRDGYPHWKKRE